MNRSYIFVVFLGIAPLYAVDQTTAPAASTSSTTVSQKQIAQAIKSGNVTAVNTLLKAALAPNAPANDVDVNALHSLAKQMVAQSKSQHRILI